MLFTSVLVPSAVAQTPAAPTVIYNEDFQNVPGPSPVLKVPAYTGADGTTYTADPPWVTNCNGWIASTSQDPTAAAPLAECGPQTWNGVQQLAYALGVGSGNPAGNYAVSAITGRDGFAAHPGAPFVELQTVNNVPFSGSNRFISFSVDVAAVNCFAAHPLLQFSLLDDAGTATPVGSEIDGCSTQNMVAVPPHGVNGGFNVQVDTYTSNEAILFSGNSIGVRLVNNQPSGGGNDHAFDNIRILDVTPTLAKSFGPADLNVGAPSTLTFTITNTSELGAKNGWSFTDNLPSGLVVADPAGASTTCSAGQVTASAGGGSVAMTGNLDAGQVSCTVTVNVTSPTPGSFTNCAANVTTVGLNPPACSPVVFRAADVAILKTTSEPVVPGEEATYTLRMTNRGPDTAVNPRASDSLPSGLTFVSASDGCSEAGGTVTCTTPSLAKDATREFTVTARADAGAECADLQNTVTVTSDTPDLDLSNNSSTVRNCVRRADRSITKDASRTQVGPGGQVMYTLVVKNNGPSDDSNVTVTDPMAAGLSLVSANPSQGTCSTDGGRVSCNLRSLKAGGSAQILVTATMTAPAAASCAASTITNTATVTGDAFDPNPDNDRDDAQVCRPPDPEPRFDLVTTKTANDRTLLIGQPVRYRIVVRNNGPDAAPGVTLTDTLNAPVRVVSVRSTQGSCQRRIPMRCELGTIAAGESVTITIRAKHRESGCRQRNAASATGAGTDTNPANNMDTVDVCVRKVRLRLSKVASRQTVQAGDTFSYRIRLRNPTKGEARNVRVCDRLPSGLRYVSSKPSARRQGARQHCWRVKVLKAGKSRTFRVTVRAAGGANGGKVNRVTASSPTTQTKRARDRVRVLGRATPVTG